MYFIKTEHTLYHPINQSINRGKMAAGKEILRGFQAALRATSDAEIEESIASIRAHVEALLTDGIQQMVGGGGSSSGGGSGGGSSSSKPVPAAIAPHPTTASSTAMATGTAAGTTANAMSVHSQLQPASTTGTTAGTTPTMTTTTTTPTTTPLEDARQHLFPKHLAQFQDEVHLLWRAHHPLMEREPRVHRTFLQCLRAVLPFYEPAQFQRDEWRLLDWILHDTLPLTQGPVVQEAVRLLVHLLLREDREQHQHQHQHQHQQSAANDPAGYVLTRTLLQVCAGWWCSGGGGSPSGGGGGSSAYPDFLPSPTSPSPPRSTFHPPPHTRRTWRRRSGVARGKTWTVSGTPYGKCCSRWSSRSSLAMRWAHTTATT